MTSIRLALALCLLFCVPALADQTAQATCSGTVASCTATFAGNVGVGSLVVVMCGAGQGNRTLTLTNSGSNEATWTQVGTNQNTGGVGSRSAGMWYAYNTAGGWTGAVCAVGGGNTNMRMIAKEYTPIGGSPWSADPLDQFAHTGGNGTAPDSGATATTTQADELIVGGGVSLATKTWTAGGSFGNLVQEPTGATLGVIAIEDRTVSATATYNGTFSLNGVATDWAAFVATFKIPAAASTGKAATSRLLMGVGR